MNNVQTLGILSVLFLAGAGIASAMPFGETGMAGQMDQKIGAAQCLDAEDKETIHDAILAGDYDTFSSIIFDCPFSDKMTEEKFLERSETLQQKEAIHEAVLAGDWETYSSLVSEYELTEGIHGAMTEESFAKFSEIANLQEEVKELRSELAEELGLEEDEHLQGKRRGRGMGPRMSGHGPNMMGPINMGE